MQVRNRSFERMYKVFHLAQSMIRGRCSCDFADATFAEVKLILSVRGEAVEDSIIREALSLCKMFSVDDAK